MWTIEKDGQTFYNLSDFLAVYSINERLLSQFKRNYSGEIAREVDEMCKAVEEAFND